LSLAEVLPIQPEPETRPCSECGIDYPAKNYAKTAWDDDATRRCSPCRAPKQIPDPSDPPRKILTNNLDVVIPDDWLDRLHSGANLRCEVMLHIDHAERLHDDSTRWRARWLEVTRLDE
jgi:hypothetical protein